MTTNGRHRFLVSGYKAASRGIPLAAALQTVRDHKQIVGLEQVNKVLMQPHWRQERDMPTH